MHQLLTAQYDLVRSARGVLLAYCATLAPADFMAPLPDFNHSSIRDVLVHGAATYQHWLVNVALGQSGPLPDAATVPDVAAAGQLYAQADELVADFLEHFQGQWQTEYSWRVPHRAEPVLLTPLALFTHVITHEFHHKGQVLSMSRQLGYTPIDTDVVRT
ncbi:damage-inducible protein DinB [Hymenobacter taeanensis]|uniref:Damage-inducible protein DinB n=1 Tax=Hymenobacter taeanensis TaxID=2735321 RepID=A0A6M6BCI7_9BACT|nr:MULTISPECIES: DinB family protein [Hymenobacter]QJX45682.1 damage-inducible protein DinB [Hymenobacter taeanensis]UOQ79519.1 DinB family protein [Hymenobacter sp. 5414T-23]